MNRQNVTLVVGLITILSVLACNAPITQEPAEIATEPGPTLPPSPGSEPTEEAEPVPEPVPPGPPIQPSDLAYLGAFRLPSDAPDEVGWMWSGEALTYYPDGDPDGPDDGFPGSLFGTGHNWNQYVSEISIPVPVISPGKNLEELNTATTLQPFQDIRGGLFDWPLEQPRAGLEYLPPQGEQRKRQALLLLGAALG